MPHPGRNNIYEATIKRMVNEALEAQEQEFACNRGNDSDEQLLADAQDDFARAIARGITDYECMQQ